MRWASREPFPAAPALCPRALAVGLGVFTGHGHHGHDGHPKLKLENKIKGKSGGDNLPTNIRGERYFFKRSAPRVAIVAIVAMGQKSLKVPC